MLAAVALAAGTAVSAASYVANCGGAGCPALRAASPRDPAQRRVRPADLAGRMRRAFARPSDCARLDGPSTTINVERLPARDPARAARRTTPTRGNPLPAELATRI